MTSFSLTYFSRRRFGLFAAILAVLLLGLFLVSMTLGKHFPGPGHSHRPVAVRPYGHPLDPDG